MFSTNSELVDSEYGSAFNSDHGGNFQLRGHVTSLIFCNDSKINTCGRIESRMRLLGLKYTIPQDLKKTSLV